MVEYPGKGHEKQEQDDPLAEYVARGAAREEGAGDAAQTTPRSPKDAATSILGEVKFTHLLHSKGGHASAIIKHCACLNAT